MKQLGEKYKLDDHPAMKISREEIEKAVSKLVGNSADFSFDEQLEQCDLSAEDGGKSGLR